MTKFDQTARINNLPWVQQNRVSSITAQVDRIYAAQGWAPNELAYDPFAECSFVYGVDPIEPLKAHACRALLAREHFALNGPKDAPPFPVSPSARENLKSGGLPHIIAWFARSLDGCDYNLNQHPMFDEYARGVMASEYAPDFIRNDEELLRRFPPRPLDGLGAGLCWVPPRVQ